MKQKMDMKNEEIGSWLSKNGLNGENMKEMNMKHIKEELGQNRDVHMENILSILPAASEGEANISSRLRLACLKKVSSYLFVKYLGSWKYFENKSNISLNELNLISKP